MKFLLDVRMLLGVLFFHGCCYAQVSFTETPKDLQLFPRDAHNRATVTFAGVIDPSDFRRISIYVKKDNAFFFHQSSAQRTNQSQPFAFQFQVEIYAQPHEYHFRVYLHTPAGDSIEVCRRERIVCGDVYVLYGQSNIVALGGIEEAYIGFDDRLFRNFDYENDDHQVSSLKWFPALQPYGHVGGIGMRLQKLILQKYGIPTCVINGGKGGLSIRQLNDRVADNPGALWTNYGQLYSRVLHANAIGKVKGVLWRQGEYEACSYWEDIDNYPARFTDLYMHLKADLGGWDKFYNIQLAIHGCNMLEKAGELREYMRKTRYLFEGLETATALGIPIVDGFHHTKEGNEQLTDEVFGMIERDIYHAPQNAELHPPDIQKVYYSASANTLTIEFEPGQQMRYPADTTIHSTVWPMKNYFYINCTTSTNNHIVEQGRAEGNKIILKLNSAINGGFLTYLPSYSTDDPPNQPIHLTNSRGLRAMSFYQFPIANQLNRPVIDSVKYVTEGQLKVFFNNSDSTIVERKKNTENSFSAIAKVTGGSYTDYVSTSDLDEVHYRIRKVNAASASDYSLTKDLVLSDCNNNLLVLSGAITRTTIKKSKKIESTQQIQAFARYSFRNKAELKPGFETTHNATFEVSVSGCNN
jgi:hypothetical protein